MSTPFDVLDAEALLARIAARIPDALRLNIVVIGSIAAAWAFRDISGRATVATKDIDLLLRPAVDAVTTAETLGQRLLDEGWEPRLTEDRRPGTPDTPDDDLPALRLAPPAERTGWFVELLAAPPESQTERRRWRRFTTTQGVFGLPSFRYLPVAIYDAEQTPFGLRVALPACMALANMLEHVEPDRTPVSTASGALRFQKDVGRAVALWWLASEQSPTAGDAWITRWDATINACDPGRRTELLAAARNGLLSIDSYVRDAHALAMLGLLAPHGTTLAAFERAYARLLRVLERALADRHRTGQDAER